MTRTVELIGRAKTELLYALAEPLPKTKNPLTANRLRKELEKLVGETERLQHRFHEAEEPSQ